MCCAPAQSHYPYVKETEFQSYGVTEYGVISGVNPELTKEKTRGSQREE